MRQAVRGVRLKGLMEIHKGSRSYWYLRRRGLPLVRLPDLPHDDPAFLAAYTKAWEEGAPIIRATSGTVAALIEACQASDAFLRLSKVYRSTLRRHFGAIRAAYGNGRYAGLRSKHIQADVARAENPTDRRKAWRFLGSFAVEEGLLSRDPSDGVTAPSRARTEGHPPWTTEEVARYRERWPIGTVPRAGMELLHWVGARIGDGVTLGPGMVDQDGVLIFRQSKTQDLAYVPWSCSLPDYAASMAADRDLMHQALAAVSKGHMTFLATAQGRTRSEKALGTLIRESALKAKVKKTAHGLRKARAVALAEAGATAHQIGAWTGHHSLKEVEHYTRAANRRRAVMGSEQERNVQTVPNSLQNGAENA